MKLKYWIGTVIVILLAFSVYAQSFAQSDACRPWTLTDSNGVRWTGTLCPEGSATSTPQGTPTISPTPIIPGTTPTPNPPGATGCILICPDEIVLLPSSGAAYESVRSLAGGSGTPDLSNQDSDVNAIVLAQALIFARTGDETYRTKVVNAIHSIVQNQSENGGRTLALGRELAAYVAAAEIIELRSFNPVLNGEFVERIKVLRTKPLDGRTLISTCEERANNWGNHACASRAAVDLYVGDVADLQRTFNVVCGWAGERNRYAGFKYVGTEWQSDPANPVGINPVGATKGGHIIDGGLPEELRRAGGFSWPPPKTNYVWGGMAGVTFAMKILNNAGYPAWECANKAMLRATVFAYNNGFLPTGDDVSIPPIINNAYGTNFAYSGFSASKNVCCTAWIFGGSAVVASDVIDDSTRRATGETTGELQDEVNYLIVNGWTLVGDLYTIETLADGTLFAQDMERLK